MWRHPRLLYLYILHTSPASSLSDIPRTAEDHTYQLDGSAPEEGK